MSRFLPFEASGARDQTRRNDGGFERFLEQQRIHNSITPRRRAPDHLHLQRGDNPLSSLDMDTYASMGAVHNTLGDLDFLGRPLFRNSQLASAAPLPTPPRTGGLTLPLKDSSGRFRSPMRSNLLAYCDSSFPESPGRRSGLEYSERETFSNLDFCDPGTTSAIDHETVLQPRGFRSPIREELFPEDPFFLAFMPGEQERRPHSSSGPGSSNPARQVALRRQQHVPSPSSILFSEREQPRFSPHATQDKRFSYIDLPHAPPIAHGIRLVSPRQALPEKFRSIFQYDLFNAVQSKCFETAYGSQDNLVVSAPTGSGKTVILELAICKLIGDRGPQNFKIVYQAPTKALCAERARDWQKKFGALGMNCAELTGDTSYAEMRRVGKAIIIVTTPEKWDSITRKWTDHSKLLELVELFLIDEVHILKDIRGATLEAVVSRMKSNGTNVRFLALSATVPNSEDIARWLGRDHTNPQLPARRETFGEDLRPVKLQKFVYGYDCNDNAFIFDKFLDQKLPMLLSRHTCRKPILIFCFTRNSCENTALKLAEYWSGMSGDNKPWKPPSRSIPVLNPGLQEIVKFGVAFHHAGLDTQDRIAVEQNFLKGDLNVICCTSTLAVGINLPCHTVVLKGTLGYSDDKLQEYSDLEVMQMLGRAGRPQFDDSAVAMILTRTAHKTRYERMVSGQETLESTLHLNLIEHLNSEIGLGTIKSIGSAKTWLGGTFLSVRLRKNPGHYDLAGSDTSFTPGVDGMLEEICERDIKLLQGAKLVTNGEKFKSTDYGRAMSKYMVEFSSMELLLGLPRGPNMETLITTLSKATEFKDFRMKPAERAMFREFNKNNLLLYPIKEAIAHTWHKISLVIQVTLGGIQYQESSKTTWLKRQFMMEKKMIFERLQRLVRCVIDCKGCDKDGIGTRVALELARAVSAEAWEDRPTQLTQIPGIGPVGMTRLVAHDIRTVHALAECSYSDIDRIMNRNPPYGKKIVDSLNTFPRLLLDVQVVGQNMTPGSRDMLYPTINARAVMRYANRNTPNWLRKSPAITFHVEGAKDGGTLHYFWRDKMARIEREGSVILEFLIPIRTFDDFFVCYFSCEEIVGTTVTKILKHRIPEHAFQRCTPALQGHIPTSLKDKAKYEIPDEDDIDDEVLLQAAQNVEALASSGFGMAAGPVDDVDDFQRIDEVLKAVTPEKKDSNGRGGTHVSRGKYTEPEPARLPNGKWKCNHACSGGAPTKIGRPCVHLCCKEGTDRPRKPKSSRSDAKKRRASEDFNDYDLTEGVLPEVHCSQRKESQPNAGKLIIPPPATSYRSVKDEYPAQQPVAPAVPSRARFIQVKKQKTGWKDINWDAENIQYIDLTGASDKSPQAEIATETQTKCNPDLPQLPILPAAESPADGAASDYQEIPDVNYQLSDSDIETAMTANTLFMPPDASNNFGTNIAALTYVLMQESAPASVVVPFKPGAHDEALFPGIYDGFSPHENQERLHGIVLDTSPTKDQDPSGLNVLHSPDSALSMPNDEDEGVALPDQRESEFSALSSVEIGLSDSAPQDQSYKSSGHADLMARALNEPVSEHSPPAEADEPSTAKELGQAAEISPEIAGFISAFCSVA